MKTITLPFMLSIMMSIGSAQEPLTNTYDLSMMDQCIDDTFSNCIEKMEEQVQKVYFPREIKNVDFKTAWDESANCAMEKLQRMQRKYSKLTINHTRAICVYTGLDIHESLNAALKTGATSYSTNAFQYHALYFWLTIALQILKSHHTTYRRTEDVYNGHKNQIIRFGHFASSSLNPNLEHFGSETCFHINTRLGAYIEQHSQIPDEEEVLIPSYEEFKIADIVPNSFGELNCKKIFVLESVGHSSTKLNCKATNHNQEMRANLALIIGFQLLIGLTLNKYSYI